jgi:hypothetical protein
LHVHAEVEAVPVEPLYDQYFTSRTDPCHARHEGPTAQM